MTNHSMVYFVSGDSYSDLHALRSGGIIDLHYVIHGGGSSAPAQVVADCNAAGLSPVLNNGNDGAAGWNGSDSYNANLAAQGWHAVGGESEQAAEIDSIMSHLIFLDYGGEGTGGGTNDCVWCQTHSAPVHGFGAASYMETYDSATNFWGWNVLSQGVKSAKAHGVKEIGICVGTWMINHSSAQDYINLAQAYEANGITCAGIGVWGGYGNNANNIYNQFSSWFKAWQAVWPPTNVTMKNRFSGPTPTPAHIPHIWCGLVGQSTLYTGTQPVGTTVGTSGMQGWLDTATQDWVPATNLTAAEKAALIVPVTLLQNGVATKTATPDANGNFSATITSPNAGVVHYNWKGNTGDTGRDMAITWTPAKTVTTISEMAVVTSGANTDKFVIGSDNAVWWKRNTNAWVSLGGIAYAGTMPTAAYINNTLNVFVVGTDRAIWSKNLTGTAWSKWASVAFTLQ